MGMILFLDYSILLFGNANLIGGCAAHYFKFDKTEYTFPENSCIYSKIKYVIVYVYVMREMRA